MNTDLDILIQKQLTGEASAEDQARLEAWLAEDRSHRVRYDEWRRLWDEAGEVAFSLDPATEEEWEKVKARIAAESDRETPVRLRPLRARWLPYAVAAVLILGLFGLWQLLMVGPVGPSFVQVYETAPGEQREITLPDGSRVALNAGAFLGLAEGFNTAERRLELRGEAFFTVTPDPARPFIVATGPVETRVLGTAFNLRAYQESAEIELNVTEGVVVFSEPESGASERVTAGEAALYDRSEESLRAAPYDELAAAWREGRIVFRQTPLSEVWRTLERRYAVTVTDRSGQGDRLYTNTFEREELEVVLEVLRRTLDLEIRREGDRITIGAPGE